MSYILEALQKAQRERELGEVPGINSEVPPVASPPGGSSWLIAGFTSALLIALLASGLALYALFWKPAEQQQPSMAQAPKPPPAEVIELPVERKTPVTMAPPIVSEPRVFKPAPKPVEVVIEEAPAPPQPAAKPEPSTAPAPTVAERPEPVIEEPEIVAAPPPPAVSDPRRISRELVNTQPVQRASHPRYAELNTLSPELRASLPPLKIMIYYFTEQADKRFVILDSQKLRQGETTDSGVRVVEIGQRGLVLEYQGQTFFKPR